MLDEHFLRKAQATTSDPPSCFSEEVLRTLMTYDHPGNVREFRNMVERAIVLTRRPLITAEDLPPLRATRESDDSYVTELLKLPLEQTVASPQRRIIRRTLDCANGNETETARILGIHCQQSHTKFKDFGSEWLGMQMIEGTQCTCSIDLLTTNKLEAPNTPDDPEESSTK
jgi:DNA-binding NtrC family response regulator